MSNKIQDTVIAGILLLEHTSYIYRQETQIFSGFLGLKGNQALITVYKKPIKYHYSVTYTFLE